tara:strand:- start:93 stop:818 length:726 start_codon:yes stop_codon:yes gene_type:complete
MINNLLYNYQNTNEFVCSDGRMSVNGICKVQQQDSVETANITKDIIKMSEDDNSDRITRKDYDKRKTDKILDDLVGTPDYFPDLGKEKKSFSWDIDKPSKIGDYKNTVTSNIQAYNNFIEENLGIPSNTQNALRAVTTASAIASGGGLAAVAGPFGIPFVIGGMMKKNDRERVQAITDQDTQGKNDRPIDMMTYDIPTYGKTGFNIHNDAGDNNNNNNSGHNAPGAGKGEGGGYASDYGFI